MDIDAFRAFCTSFPGATEDVKWGANLVFSVSGKMFCISDLEPPFSRSFKVPDEDFEDLCQRPDFAPAPYLARSKWVQVQSPAGLTNAQWETFVRQSYALVRAKLPRKLREGLG